MIFLLQPPEFCSYRQEPICPVCARFNLTTIYWASMMYSKPWGYNHKQQVHPLSPRGGCSLQRRMVD
jgi:hypothetical protein